MNIGMYYFSGTGLTAHFAEWIASALEKAGHTPSLFRYKEGMELPDPASFDCIGIGAPTYSFYAPRRFLSYLKKIPAGNGKPFFLFHSCHSKQGLTAWGMHRVLKKRGYVSLGESLEMSGINNIRAWRPLSHKERNRSISFHSPMIWINGPVI